VVTPRLPAVVPSATSMPAPNAHNVAIDTADMLLWPESEPSVTDNMQRTLESSMRRPRMT